MHGQDILGISAMAIPCKGLPRGEQVINNDNDDDDDDDEPSNKKSYH